jgi:NADPH-dependent curcumin reductase
MKDINRQWLLRSRPTDHLDVSHFEYRESPMPQPNLAAGEILVRNLYLGFDASQREWTLDKEGYWPPVKIGDVMRGAAVAQVIRSTNPAFPEGCLTSAMYGWQEYAVADISLPMPPARLPDGISPTTALAVFGATTLTAYFGLIEVGGLKAGQTVVVSAAAGATGSAAVQIAALRGARVIGIAGGAQKCATVCGEYGADAAIDYRHENVDQRLAELCPNGIDLYYDNVGGSILQGAIANMAHHGRIVLCGQIVNYDQQEPAPGPNNLMLLVYRQVRMEGFLILAFAKQIPDAMKEIGAWVAAGKLRVREDIQHGFENIPRTLMRLYRSENDGKQLLKLADPS